MDFDIKFFNISILDVKIIQLYYKLEYVIFFDEIFLFDDWVGGVVFSDIK